MISARKTAGSVLLALLFEHGVEAAVVDGDADATRDLCRRISARLAERNRLCRLNK